MKWLKVSIPFKTQKEAEKYLREKLKIGEYAEPRDENGKQLAGIDIEIVDHEEERDELDFY